MSRYFRAIQGIQTAIASGGWPSARSLEIALNNSPQDGAPIDSSRPWEITLNPADLVLKDLSDEVSEYNLIPSKSLLSFLKVDFLLEAALLGIAAPKCSVCDDLTMPAAKNSAVEAIKRKSEGTLVIALRPTDPNFTSLSIDQAIQFSGGSSLILDGARVKGAALEDLLTKEVSSYASLRILLKTFSLPLSPADEAELIDNFGGGVKLLGQLEWSVALAGGEPLTFESFNPDFICPNNHPSILNREQPRKFLSLERGLIELVSSELKSVKISELAHIFASSKVPGIDGGGLIRRSLQALLDFGFGEYSLDCRLDELSIGERLRLILARALLISSKDLSLELREVFAFLETSERARLIELFEKVGVGIDAEKYNPQSPKGGFGQAKVAQKFLRFGPYDKDRYKLPEISVLVGEINIVHGPSGVGKEVLMSCLYNDKSIRGSFKRILKIPHFQGESDGLFMDLLGLTKPLARLFASTAEARMAGLAEKQFYSSSKGGYCWECLSRHSKVVQSAPFAASECSICDGAILIGAVGLISFGGFTFGKLLKSTMGETRPLLSGVREVASLLSLVEQLGLSGIKLGVQGVDLSSDDIRLCYWAANLYEVIESDKFCLVIIEHPFVGLSDSGKSRLKALLQGFCNLGHTVIVIDNSGSFYESSLNMIGLEPESAQAGRFLIKVSR